ncbi:MAG TPA: aminotransferase class V-fold PLP-dependent enzyme [Candidatus Udaeobacter sp.]|nr:aminotransferase class V-fold PLP-dependent enzyme [Candidatus Udaeobacter sp.]
MHRPLIEDAAARAARYLDSLPERPVRPDPEAVKGLAAWDTPLPDAPTDPHEVLKRLDEIGSGATMAMAGPRFFGFVIGGALPVTVAANWLATAWDQNTGLFAATPATAELERISLGWLLDLFDLPKGCGGSFVTGAAVANLVSLAAARHAVLERAGWDVERDGLFGAPEVTVVVGEEAHPTVTKALGLLGLGRERVVAVPVDRQGRMRADAFPELTGPSIVCLQAGNVNTGSIDPLRELIPRAKGAGAWVHVDGAFGLWAKAVPELRSMVEGIEDADSWATDAHKWLNVPYDCGLAFTRDPLPLRSALAIHAAYLPTGAPRDPSHYTPELSRRARGVEVWSALLSLGRSGVAEMIGRSCRHARRFADGLRAAGFEILNEVVLNQVLVSFGAPEQTERVIAAIQEDGTCWCGGTLWQGRTAMRISVSCWATTDADVERSLEAMRRAAAKIRG